MRGRRLVLDAMTLSNLDVLVNSSLGGTGQATLLGRLNTCSTPFGQRLLRAWMCAPLCQPESIADRQKAVAFLAERPSLLADLEKLLKPLPDLERLLNKIHSLGSGLRARNHPDSRAVFFDLALYGRKRIHDFLSTLDALDKSRNVLDLFRDQGSSGSRLLERVTTVRSTGGSGTFPRMDEQLQFFRGAFDVQLAEKEGKIIPRAGVDAEYDDSIAEIDRIARQAEQYLAEQRSRFGGVKVAFVGADKKRFQLEIPDSGSPKIDSGYQLQGQRRGFRRFHTERSKDFLARTLRAEQARDSALKDIARRIFEQFDSSRSLWASAAECLAVLDVLGAMAAYSNSGGVMCTPEFVPASAGVAPFLSMLQGSHPCYASSTAGAEFIPNDVHIGSADGDAPDSTAGATLKLLTGPNMGGKSTLMRQVGLCVILAQMGCCVPAESLRLTPVDRLFTRLGAADHILGGESTFFVELSETASILKHATRHSLVLVDELGRGTATFDGTAIAYSVALQLARSRCRTIFSTHYHSLVNDLAGVPATSVSHMACMVVDDDGGGGDQQEHSGGRRPESIVFLYKLVHGACPKSYGFHAARLAGLQPDVIGRALAKAELMEQCMEQVQMFRQVFAPPSP